MIKYYGEIHYLIDMNVNMFTVGGADHYVNTYLHTQILHTAIQINMTDACTDVLTVTQQRHSYEQQYSLIEIQRIMTFALVFNGMDTKEDKEPFYVKKWIDI